MKNRLTNVILVVAAMAAVMPPTGCGRQTPGAKTMIVKRETLPITVTEVGQLEPKEYEVVAAPISGILVDLIKEGTYVHKGDVAGRMNDEDAKDDLETQLITIKNRVAMLRDAELDREETTQDLEYEQQKAQVQLELSELDLKELELKPAAPVAALATIDPSYWKVATDVAKKLADLDVEYGDAAEATSLKKYERQKVLTAQGVASENDLAAARLQYEKDRTVHESAVITQELLQKGTPEGDIETAREKVKQAKITLEQTQKNAQVQINLKKTAIAVAQAELNRSQETVNINRQIVESTVARAPVEGTALYWGPWNRPHVGDYIWHGNGFVSITQVGKMLALTRVNEVDARRVGVGQKALVRLEAIPGKVYHGKVIRMAGLATDRDERSQGMLRRDLAGVMVFEVTVEIEECDPAMRPTMSGTVEIITDELRNVIALPSSALMERDGKRFVRVINGGRVVERKVKVAGTYKSKTVVAEGLREGDVVCLM
jgi:multidrug resistance efflux pump